MTYREQFQVVDFIKSAVDNSKVDWLSGTAGAALWSKPWNNVQDKISGGYMRRVAPFDNAPHKGDAQLFKSLKDAYAGNVFSYNHYSDPQVANYFKANPEMRGTHS